MKILITFLLLLTLNIAAPVARSQEQQVVPYTLADRDRIIRLEARMGALETKMDAKFAIVDAKFAIVDAKFDSMNKRIDYLFWMMGVMIALVIFILGYMIWDRRTALKPALDKAEAADLRSSTIVRALRDYAKDHPDLANFLKIHGLL